MSEKEIVALQVKLEEMEKDQYRAYLNDEQQFEAISSLKSKIAVLEAKMVIIYSVLGVLGTAVIGAIIGLILK